MTSYRLSDGWKKAKILSSFIKRGKYSSKYLKIMRRSTKFYIRFKMINERVYKMMKIIIRLKVFVM